MVEKNKKRPPPEKKEKGKEKMKGGRTRVLRRTCEIIELKSGAPDPTKIGEASSRVPSELASTIDTILKMRLQPKNR